MQADIAKRAQRRCYAHLFFVSFLRILAESHKELKTKIRVFTTLSLPQVEFNNLRATLCLNSIFISFTKDAANFYIHKHCITHILFQNMLNT